MLGGKHRTKANLGERHTIRAGNFSGVGEPALSDMMGDPVLIALLKSDNIHPEELRVLIDEVSASL